MTLELGPHPRTWLPGLCPPVRATGQASTNPLSTTAHWGLERKVSHAPGSGPAFCPPLSSRPHFLSPLRSRQEGGPPPPPQPLCHLLDHCSCSFSGKRLVAWSERVRFGCFVWLLLRILEAGRSVDFPSSAPPHGHSTFHHSHSIHPFSLLIDIYHTQSPTDMAFPSLDRKHSVIPTQTPSTALHKHTSYDRPLASADSACDSSRHTSHAVTVDTTVPRGMYIITPRTKYILTDTRVQ